MVADEIEDDPKSENGPKTESEVILNKHALLGVESNFLQQYDYATTHVIRVGRRWPNAAIAISKG